jgi:ElaB/YqjD/DUF883 family membrane-anchored ribosome-binding protein
MKDKAFENKVNRDVDQAKEDLTTLGEDGVTGLTRKYEQLADGAKEKVAVAVKAINKGVGQGLKGVGHGLDQFNAKVQDVADRVPGDLGKKAAGYPWVTITLSLAFGLLLGVLLLKPTRQPLG